jgi:hypothetical protein
MCLFCVCAVLCIGSGLATSWSLFQEVLPILNRSGDWKAARAHKGCRANQKNLHCYSSADDVNVFLKPELLMTGKCNEVFSDGLTHRNGLEFWRIKTLSPFNSVPVQLTYFTYLRQSSYHGLVKKTDFDFRYRNVLRVLNDFMLIHIYWHKMSRKLFSILYYNCRFSSTCIRIINASTW